MSKKSRKRSRRASITCQNGRSISGQAIREVFDLAAKEMPSEPEAAPEQEQATSVLPMDVYYRERTAFIEMEHKSSEQHDKAILTLAAGALALSLTFVEKIAPHPKTATVGLIAASWAAFILSIITILASFLTSQIACRKQCESLDNLFAGKGAGPQLTKWAVVTERLNLGSYLSFVAGLIALAVFGFFNLPSGHENAMHEQSPRPQSIDLTPKPLTGRVAPRLPVGPTNSGKGKPQPPVKK